MEIQYSIESTSRWILRKHDQANKESVTCDSGRAGADVERDVNRI